MGNSVHRNEKMFKIKCLRVHICSIYIISEREIKKKHQQQKTRKTGDLPSSSHSPSCHRPLENRCEHKYLNAVRRQEVCEKTSWRRGTSRATLIELHREPSVNGALRRPDHDSGFSVFSQRKKNFEDTIFPRKAVPEKKTQIQGHPGTLHRIRIRKNPDEIRGQLSTAKV